MSTPRPTFRASSKNTMKNHALGVGNLAIPVIYSYLLCRTHASVFLRYQTSIGVPITNPLAHILLIQISPVLSSSLHSAGLSGYLRKTAFSRLYLVHSFSHSQGQGLHTRMFITGINFHEHKVPRGFDSSFFAYYVLSCELFHYLYSTLHGYIFPRYHHISAQSFQAQSLNTLQNPMYHQIQRRDSTRLDPYSQSAYVVNRTPKTNHWNSLWLDAFVPKCFSRGVAIEHPKNSIHPDLNTSSPHLYHCISAMVSG